MRLTANVVGATGLVGKQLVDLLLEDKNFEKVKIFVRRDSGIQHSKLEEHIVDFGDEKSWKEKLKGDVLFSTLGTTLKQAGSKEKQYEIDFTLNYNFAKAAAENGIPNYVLVSSMSANPKAKLFYPRMKGELDAAVMELGFKNCTIIRPGPLAGNRQEKRLGEVIAIPIVGFLTKLILKKYRPIEDYIVARAMINTVTLPQSETIIYEGEDVFNLAAKK